MWVQNVKFYTNGHVHRTPFIVLIFNIGAIWAHNGRVNRAPFVGCIFFFSNLYYLLGASSDHTTAAYIALRLSVAFSLRDHWDLLLTGAMFSSKCSVFVPLIYCIVFFSLLFSTFGLIDISIWRPSVALFGRCSVFFSFFFFSFLFILYYVWDNIVPFVSETLVSTNVFLIHYAVDSAAGSSSLNHAQDPAIYRQQMMPLWDLSLRIMHIPDHGVKVAILNIARVLMFYRGYFFPRVIRNYFEFIAWSMLLEYAVNVSWNFLRLCIPCIIGIMPSSHIELMCFHIASSI